MGKNLKSKYIKALLMEFPTELDSCIDYFYRMSDDVDYSINIDIFEGKKWLDVEFEPYANSGVDFLMLNEYGQKYYLPALLKNFYELEYTEMRYFEWLIFHLCRKKYDYFSYLTPQQSKLVAMFLVNVANLDGGDSYAQKAITSYWGNFLLF